MGDLLVQVKSLQQQETNVDITLNFAFDSAVLLLQCDESFCWLIQGEAILRIVHPRREVGTATRGFGSPFRCNGLHFPAFGEESNYIQPVELLEEIFPLHPKSSIFCEVVLQLSQQLVCPFLRVICPSTFPLAFTPWIANTATC